MELRDAQGIVINGGRETRLIFEKLSLNLNKVIRLTFCLPKGSSLIMSFREDKDQKEKFQFELRSIDAVFDCNGIERCSRNCD
jgi:hypothetical protein